MSKTNQPCMHVAFILVLLYGMHECMCYGTDIGYGYVQSCGNKG